MSKMAGCSRRHQSFAQAAFAGFLARATPRAGLRLFLALSDSAYMPGEPTVGWLLDFCYDHFRSGAILYLPIRQAHRLEIKTSGP